MADKRTAFEEADRELGEAHARWTNYDPDEDRLDGEDAADVTWRMDEEFSSAVPDEGYEP